MKSKAKCKTKKYSVENTNLSMEKSKNGYLANTLSRQILCILKTELWKLKVLTWQKIM